MGKSFYYGVLSYFVGSAIAAIILAVIMRIGWTDKEKILIFGYGALTSVLVFYVKAASLIKKGADEKLEERFKKEREQTNKDIESIKCQLGDMKQMVVLVSQQNSEMHATVDKIWEKISE